LDGNIAYAAFDILRLSSRSTVHLPLSRRRELLAETLQAHERLTPTFFVDRADLAAGWLKHDCAGIEGVVAKRVSQTYVPGHRGWIKVKRRLSLDAVVAGCRPGNRLLLGLYRSDGSLSHVGETVSLTPSQARLVRSQLVPALGQVWTGRMPGVGHWDSDRYEEWIDCVPRLVVEVSYTQTDWDRFRHPVRLLRVRPDREPQSCDIDQLLGSSG
jgi:ATP-dependent DNA ligase